MRTDAAQPQGISHTCFLDGVYHYMTPMPGSMVKTRDELLIKFGQKQTTKTIQQNTFKS